MSSTRPAQASDAGHEPLLGLFIPPAPGLPRGALFVVGTPVSKASPSRVIDVEGELVSDVRAA